MASHGIDAAVLAEIRRHAEETYPDECCGIVFDDRVHRSVNVQDRCHADDPGAFPRSGRTAFRLADADQVLLARSFDGQRPARVLYHSHIDTPVGRGAYFSVADVTGATLLGRPLYPDLLHLVVVVREGRAAEAALFALGEDGPREVVRWD